MNENKESDFVDSMNDMKKTEQYQDTINISQQKANDSRTQNTEKNNLKREDLALKREKMNNDLTIAETNKNQYDVPSKKPKAEKKK